MLWNVYQFYKQYQTSVEAEVKRLRSPIEKQLKVCQIPDLVKSFQFSQQYRELL